MDIYIGYTGNDRSAKPEDSNWNGCVQWFQWLHMQIIDN